MKSASRQFLALVASSLVALGCGGGSPRGGGGGGGGDGSSCTNDCTSGAGQCTAQGLSLCSQGADGCYHWGSAVACQTGQVCQNGKCSCTDDCASGAAQCTDQGPSTCSQGTDGCYHWSSPVPCQTGYVCQNGSCVYVPSTHTLASGTYESFAAGSYYGQPFTLPLSGEVDYDVQCRSTSSCDTFDVGVFTAAEWSYFSNGQNASAYAEHDGVTTANDATTVPAGDYVLGFLCTNSFERCQISYDLSATY